MARLPKKVKERIITLQDTRIPFLYSRVELIDQGKGENLQFTRDQYTGQIIAYYSVIEDILMDYGCYNGYSEGLASGYRYYSLTKT